MAPMNMSFEFNTNFKKEVIGLIPTCGKASRSSSLPCSKELHPGYGGHNFSPKVVSHYLLKNTRIAEKKLLSLVGLKLSRISSNAKSTDDNERLFKEKYENYYKLVEENRRGFKAIRAYRYDIGWHPFNMNDLEFEFTAYYLHKLNPSNILDIGSYRHFILGLLSYYDVTTVDIRERKTVLDNEHIVTCDAKSLTFSDNCFDGVISLGAFHTFGLCRYGDDFDLDADIKGFDEMIRVLKPGKVLIFSVAITRGEPSIAFNAHRNYSYAMIRDFCRSLECVEEKFINRRNPSYCSYDEITTDPKCFDDYIGCWKKKS